MVLQDGDFDRLPDFDGSVMTGGRGGRPRKKRECFLSPGVVSCRPSGFINKMCGGIVGERTGLVKGLDERTTLVWGSFYRCQAAQCGLSSGGV